MKKTAKFIAYHPKLITIIAVLLLIPSAIGYINTFVNYDILSYLPGELDSVKGEEELDETFNSASMSFLVIEDMPSKDIVALKEKIAKVENVSSVMWVDDIADIRSAIAFFSDSESNLKVSVIMVCSGEKIRLSVIYSGLSCRRKHASQRMFLAILYQSYVESAANVFGGYTQGYFYHFYA